MHLKELFLIQQREHPNSVREHSDTPHNAHPTHLSGPPYIYQRTLSTQLRAHSKHLRDPSIYR